MELKNFDKELQKRDKPKKEERLDETFTLLTAALASAGFVFLLRAIIDIVKNRKNISPAAIIKRWNEIADMKAQTKELRKQGAQLDLELAKTKKQYAAMKKEGELLAKILPKMNDPEVISAGRDYLQIAQGYLNNTRDADRLLAKSQAFGRFREVLQNKMTPFEIDTLSDLLDRKAREDKALMN
jgi:hypothetical protein